MNKDLFIIIEPSYSMECELRSPQQQLLEIAKGKNSHFLNLI